MSIFSDTALFARFSQIGGSEKVDPTGGNRMKDKIGIAIIARVSIFTTQG